VAALKQGCHIYCDKPLTATAAQARELYQLAQEMKVKTAYAASYRYQPHVLLARELVAAGAIGEPLEVECVSHYNLNPLIPFGWSHRLDLGGGRLNNNFTHKLSLVLHVLDGQLRAVKGEARNDMPRAPIVEGVHDFRERGQFAPSSAEAEGYQWAEVDSEWSYTVMAQIEPTAAHRLPVSALFRHGGLQPRFHDDYVAFYGRDAAIHINGSYALGPLYLRQRGSDWEAIPLPERITAALPAIEDNTQRNWTQLAREFVADIRGEGNSGYQTFKDGWLFQKAIEAVRNDDHWYPLPTDG
jgi:predicted dehydrogenase